VPLISTAFKIASMTMMMMMMMVVGKSLIMRNSLSSSLSLSLFYNE
jgi:hypothetical protein